MSDDKFKITSGKEAREAFARLIYAVGNKYDRAADYHALLDYFGDMGDYRLLLPSYTNADDGEEVYLRRFYANISDEALSMVVQARILHEGIKLGSSISGSAFESLSGIMQFFRRNDFELSYGVLATAQESNALQERYPFLKSLITRKTESFENMLNQIMEARVRYELLEQGNRRVLGGLKTILNKLFEQYPDLDYGILASVQELESMTVEEKSNPGATMKKRFDEAGRTIKRETLSELGDQPPHSPRGRG